MGETDPRRALEELFTETQDRIMRFCGYDIRIHRDRLSLEFGTDRLGTIDTSCVVFVKYRHSALFIVLNRNLVENILWLIKSCPDVLWSKRSPMGCTTIYLEEAV